MPNFLIAVDPNFDLATSFPGRNLAIASDGTLWAVYARRVGSIDLIYLAHSHDGGATWTEEDVSVDANNHGDPVIAIDSTDTLHIAYTTKGRAPFPSAWGIFYKQRSVAGVWSAEETVSLQNTGVNSPTSSLAIDSSDDVHIGISTKGYGVNSGQWNIVYRKRSAGVWGAVVQITDLATPQGVVAIAVDSVNGVHLIWNGQGWGTHPSRWQVVYSHALGVGEIVCDEDKNGESPHIAVDSLNNPHVVWVNSTDSQVWYSTKAAGLWSAPTRVDDSDGVDRYSLSIAIDRLDDIHVLWSGWPFGPPWLVINLAYRRTLAGVWQSSVFITSEADNEQLYGHLLWATFPIISGVHTNILQTQQDFIWKSMYTAVMFGYLGIAVATVQTDPATELGTEAATLNGMLDDDGGEACACGFEWGETDAYGNTTPTQSRTSGESFPQAITGLTPGITYHFRAFATNSAGTGYGSDRTFTTKNVPAVRTCGVTNIELDSAVLIGELTDDGGEACEVSFEWGLTTLYGNVSTWQGGKHTGDAFWQIIASLEPDITYHFRAQARNSVGAASGTDMSFKTLTRPEAEVGVPYSIFNPSLLLLMEDEPVFA